MENEKEKVSELFVFAARDPSSTPGGALSTTNETFPPTTNPTPSYLRKTMLGREEMQVRQLFPYDFGGSRFGGQQLSLCPNTLMNETKDWLK